MALTNRVWITFIGATLMFSSTVLSLPGHAATVATSQGDELTSYIKLLPATEQKKIETYERVIRDHLNQNFSIIRTVRILTTHYPQDVEQILLAAYQQHPKRIAVISRAVIRSEPALTTDVLDTALSVAPGDCEEIVRMAIEAEPAYIDDIVAVAAQHAPEKLDSIIRIAITTEPDFSGSIVRSAALSSPKQFFDALVNAVTQIPDSAQTIFYAVRDFFTDNEKAPQTVPATSSEQWNAFISQAKTSGVTRKEMEWFKERGYITEQQLTAVYENNN